MSMRRSAGFSMVEVLVSVVILCIGLLGTAGLMSTSLRNTNTAYYRSLATIFADDILDRMRANLSAAKNGDYDLDPGGDPGGASNTMSYFDCTDWKDALATELPGGLGSITIDGDGVALITISWDGDNTFTTQSRL
jgi:type IV pilus assembly protein PilV